MKYRQDIDGLRAIAVISVVMMHSFEDRFPNGFLGVDVFFVISGFVITASLLDRRDLPLSDYLLTFYVRRLTRLMPALLLVIAVTSVAISLFAPSPNQYLKTGLFALFGLANTSLYIDGQDYFSNDSALNPFTHAWSLGVEEQFYLLIPLALWFLLRKNDPGLAIWIFSVTSIASFLAWAGMGKVDPDAAFFLLPFRFWELATGVLVALLLHQSEKQRSSVFNGLRNPAIGSICATLLIGILVFPTGLPLIPATVTVTGCTVLILLRDISRTPIGSFLSGPTMNQLGRSSYSIYLWHWPLLVLGSWTIGGGWIIDTGLVILSVFIGLTSYRYVENPIRYGFPLRGASAIGAWISLTAIVSVAPLSIAKFLPSLYLGQTPKMHSIGVSSLTTDFIINDNSRWMGEECILDSDADVGKVIDVSLCTFRNQEYSTARVLVAGNSFSAAFVPAFAELSDVMDAAITITSSWGASPVNTIPASPRWSEANDYYWSEIFPDLIADLQDGDSVVLASDLAQLSPDVPTDESRQRIELLRSGLSTLSSNLSERGIPLFVLGPLPFARESKCSPVMASPQWFSPKGSPSCHYYERAATRLRQGPLLDTLADLETRGLLTVIDLVSVFCPSDVCTYRATDGSILYRDVYSHPSVEAALLSVEPIRETLSKELDLSGLGGSF